MGVEGGTTPEPEATGLVGDTGLRGEGGVTSVCNIELKIELACSMQAVRDGTCRSPKETRL